MKKVVFLSFGDNKYKPTLKRIEKEALHSGFFSDIKVLSDKDLAKEYKKKYKDRFKLRGFGYWMWKSYIIKKEISNLNDGDIIVYADAGCTINNLARKRFNEYIEYITSSKSGILTFSQENLIERYYTKADLLSFTKTLQNKSIIDSPQLWAGCFFIRKCNESISFVEEWFNLCHNHFHLITDEPSLINNLDGFITHRHDQSAFSVLAKLYAPTIISAKETYTQQDFKADLKDYPIWATRKRDYTWIYLKIHGIKNRINKTLNYFKFK